MATGQRAGAPRATADDAGQNVLATEHEGLPNEEAGEDAHPESVEENEKLDEPGASCSLQKVEDAARPPDTVEGLLAECFEGLYNSIRFGSSVLEGTLKELHKRGIHGLRITGCSVKVIAGTNQAWNPATRDLRDRHKSLSFSVCSEMVESHKLYWTQFYRFEGSITGELIIALAIVARMLDVAMPNIVRGPAEEDELMLCTNGIASILHTACSLMQETASSADELPRVLEIRVEDLNRIGGCTFVAICENFICLVISGVNEENKIHWKPWEALFVYAFNAGITDLPLLRAMVYVEALLSSGDGVSPSIVEHSEAFDVLVSHADEVLSNTTPKMIEADFEVLRLCRALEGASAEELELVDLLYTCNLGGENLSKLHPDVPSLDGANSSNSAGCFGSSLAEEEPGASSHFHVTSGTIPRSDAAQELAERTDTLIVSAEEAQEAFKHFKETGDIESGARASVFSLTDDIACLKVASGRGYVAEGLGCSQMLQNLSLAVDDDIMPSLKRPVLLGKLQLLPPSKVSWLGEGNTMSMSAVVDGQRWDLRIRDRKLFIKTRGRSVVSSVVRRLKVVSGVQVLGNGLNLTYQTENSVDGGLVSEVLRGLYGNIASRWLLDHIWRGNISVSPNSSTRSYCPVQHTEGGYDVCALIPFEVIDDTRFYFHRELEKVFWLPRQGEKLRELSVTRGGTIRMEETDFEAEDLERCSVISKRRIG